VVNAGALEYMVAQGLAKAKIHILETHGEIFENSEEWETHLESLGIDSKRHKRIALIGSLFIAWFSTN
jgi:hypothetical protein